jgi:hypothetical protein
MDEQLAFARLLKYSGQGIALCRPSQDVDVGDICYWDSNGTATRILNVFENGEVRSNFEIALIVSQWLAENKWPKLAITKQQALKTCTNDTKLPPAFGQGCDWGSATV